MTNQALPPQEPSLSSVHADLVGRLDQDARLRAVEQHVAALKLLPAEIQRMEDRLLEAIRDTKPKPIWPAVSALAAVLSIVLLLAAAIYGQ